MPSSKRQLLHYRVASTYHVRKRDGERLSKTRFTFSRDGWSCDNNAPAEQAAEEQLCELKSAVTNDDLKQALQGLKKASDPKATMVAALGIWLDKKLIKSVREEYKPQATRSSTARNTATVSGPPRISHNRPKKRAPAQKRSYRSRQQSPDDTSESEREMPAARPKGVKSATKAFRKMSLDPLASPPAPPKKRRLETAPKHTPHSVSRGSPAPIFGDSIVASTGLTPQPKNLSPEQIQKRDDEYRRQLAEENTLTEDRIFVSQPGEPRVEDTIVVNKKGAEALMDKAEKKESEEKKKALKDARRFLL